MKIHLVNKDSGKVLVELRYSNADRPYEENLIAPGFPRYVEREEVVEIDPLDYEEVLYRRSRGHNREELNWQIFRISATHNYPIKRAYLWNT